jgi:hypothetical protein
MTACPHCGTEDGQVRPNDTHDAFAWVCAGCRARGPEALSKANALLLWQQRVPVEEVKP